MAQVPEVTVLDANGMPRDIATITALLALLNGSNLIGGVTPRFVSGGNVLKQTSGTGANWVAFDEQAAKQLTIVNDTGFAIEFRQGGGGVALPISNDKSFTIFGIANASDIEVRRVDQNNSQVNVKARWEA